MTRTMAAIGMTLLLAPAAAASVAQDAAQVETGQELYAKNKCQTCHSIDGKGSKMSPLDGVGSKLSADEIRKWLVSPKEMEAKLEKKPKVSMKSYASLPKEDIDALVAYMQSLKK